MLIGRMRRWLILAVSAVLLIVAAGPMVGRAQESDLRAADQARGLVTGVIDAASLQLDDGRKVRLIGLEPAERPLGLSPEDPWPFAAEAAEALHDLVQGQTVSLRFEGLQQDRHGHVLAQVDRADDGHWLQGALLRRGLARVGTLPDTHGSAAAMLALEEAARRAGLGLWGHPAMALRSPTNIGDFVDSFQIVEGLVLDVADVRGRTFLNFGPDWREDFTVTIPPGDRDRFAAAGLDPVDLIGRSVRVRGWVDVRNGPQIEATHPEQIEVLTGD